jgi:hypothetical protein
MNLVKFCASILTIFFIFEKSILASTQVTVVPENYTKIPMNLGTPTLFLTLNGDTREKVYPLKGSEPLSLSFETPIKEAHIEFGSPHRVAHCQGERNKAVNKGPVTISVRYENEKFDCILMSE